MERRYLAFDVEIAKLLPEDATDIKAYRPLGICCAATLGDGDQNARRWCTSEPDGRPSKRMSQADLSQLVDCLRDQVAAGYTIVSWNGLGFDFDILAEESGRLDDCKRLAVDHVDMMFHVFCIKGFAVALESAAQGIGSPGKLDGMHASMAPQLWAQGQTDKVLEYVERDCAVTLAVALTNERQGFFAWLTRRGSRSRLELPQGWLPVRRALCLSEPDTSWMTTPPWPRQKFTRWL